MKYFILFAILFSYSAVAQWTSLNPHPTGSTSYIGSAPSADRYITVTGQGEAIVTHDGGATWSLVAIGGDGIYRSTYFHNDNLGWAVGSFNPRLHKTMDGGLTWTHQPNAPDTTKYDVYFVNENVGWSIGFNGLIIKTTDGGNNWFSQTNWSVTTRTLYGVYAVDENNVWVVGNNETILKSTNGGDTWTALPAIFSPETSYRGVYFLDVNTGFVIGNRSRIAKTTDGGNTWTPVNTPTGTVQLWTVDFNSQGVGLAVGASSQVWRSTDFGNTWNLITGFPSTSIIFYSGRFGSDNIAYISGGSGYFFKSTDAGLTWETAGYRFTSQRIRDVSFADNNNGYVVGTNLVAKTTDGGKTWAEQVSPYTGDISEVVALTPDIAVAGCGDGNILRTANGGNTWQQVITGISGTNSTILAIDFADENYGLAAAYNGTVVRTTDGGATWAIISTIVGTSPWDMHMVTSKNAWVSGTGERIVKTSDGGFTWVEQFAGGGLGTYGISFVDTIRGVAGGTGGNTYYTEDGGNTWTPALTKPGHTVWGIHITSSPVYGTVAMTASASGYVYISIDGGRNWSQEPRFTISTMDDVWMTDAANAWFVGNSGLILKYYEPGNIPVELNSFTASVTGKEVNLTWITSTELNNSGFEIERKYFLEETGGWNDFSKIGFIGGKGTTTEMQRYSYVDSELPNGNYQYRIKQIDFDGTYQYHNLVETIEIDVLYSFALHQNYPNPFNPSTVINFELQTPGFVNLKVYDILGREVTTLINEVRNAGKHSVIFSTGQLQLTSGIYFYQINAGDYSEVRKMMLIR